VGSQPSPLLLLPAIDGDCLVIRCHMTEPGSLLSVILEGKADSLGKNSIRTRIGTGRPSFAVARRRCGGVGAVDAARWQGGDARIAKRWKETGETHDTGAMYNHPARDNGRGGVSISLPGGVVVCVTREDRLPFVFVPQFSSFWLSLVPSLLFLCLFFVFFFSFFPSSFLLPSFRRLLLPFSGSEPPPR